MMIVACAAAVRAGSIAVANRGEVAQDMIVVNASTTDSLRARVLAGESTVGTFLNLGSAVSAEICGRAGCDWVVIDLEHGSGTGADLLGQVQAVNCTGAAALVRVEHAARTHVSRALDFGAEGIVFPRLRGADEVREAARFIRLPPEGVRGVASQNRAGQFGCIPLIELGALGTRLLGIVQVETTEILAELDDVAATDGVDVLFVGPGDLSYALGVPGRLDDPTYLATLDAVVAACRRNACAPGILVREAADVERTLARGFRFVGIASDSFFVMNGAAAAVAGFRAAALHAGV